MWLFEFLFGRREDKEWEKIKKEKERINEEWRRLDEERRRLFDEIEEERRRLRERARELWDLEDRVIQQERRLKRMLVELEDKEEDLKRRERKIIRKEEQLAKVMKKIKQKMQEIKKGENKIRKKERELRKRERELEAMAKEGFVKMVPVQIKIRGQDQERFHTVINFEVPLQYAGLIRSEIQKDLSGTEYKLTDDGFYWKFRVRAYSDKQGEQNPRWFHVLRWLEDNRVILNQEQYVVVSTTSGIAGWDPKEVELGKKEYKITHICESITTSGFAEVEVMVGESAQKEEEDEIPF